MAWVGALYSTSKKYPPKVCPSCRTNADKNNVRSRKISRDIYRYIYRQEQKFASDFTSKTYFKLVENYRALVSYYK